MIDAGDVACARKLGALDGCARVLAASQAPTTAGAADTTTRGTLATIGVLSKASEIDPPKNFFAVTLELDGFECAWLVADDDAADELEASGSGGRVVTEVEVTFASLTLEDVTYEMECDMCNALASSLSADASRVTLEARSAGSVHARFAVRSASVGGAAHVRRGVARSQRPPPTHGEHFVEATLLQALAAPSSAKPPLGRARLNEIECKIERLAAGRACEIVSAELAGGDGCSVEVHLRVRRFESEETACNFCNVLRACLDLHARIPLFNPKTSGALKVTRAEPVITWCDRETIAVAVASTNSANAEATSGDLVPSKGDAVATTDNATGEKNIGGCTDDKSSKQAGEHWAELTLRLDASAQRGGSNTEPLARTRRKELEKRLQRLASGRTCEVIGADAVRGRSAGLVEVHIRVRCFEQKDSARRFCDDVRSRLSITARATLFDKRQWGTVELLHAGVAAAAVAAGDVASVAAADVCVSGPFEVKCELIIPYIPRANPSFPNAP